MTEDKLEELIKGLLSKTKKRMVIWKNTNRDSEYLVNLKSGSVTVDYFKSTYEDQWFHDFNIYNTDGNRIETLQLLEDDETILGVLLSSLYREAKRQFLKVEETLDGMLAELSKDEIVGNIFDPDDDLPF